MKVFNVSGFAFVRVKVQFRVTAKDSQAAMKEANLLFKENSGIRNNSIIIGSEDYGAVHSFDATNAEKANPKARGKSK